MGVLFVLFCAWLIAGSLDRPDVATYEPGVHPRPGGDPPGSGRLITVDARDGERWVGVDLSRGTPVSERGPWDLAFRRHEVRLAVGGAEEGELGDWYRYDFLSHVLTPRDRTYRVPLREGGTVELRFLSYYCPGPTAGCVTFRYRPADAVASPPRGPDP